MKVITEYQCEICLARHQSRAAAARCERKGVPPMVPVGLVYDTPKYLSHDITPEKK